MASRRGRGIGADGRCEAPKKRRKSSVSKAGADEVDTARAAQPSLKKATRGTECAVCALKWQASLMWGEHDSEGHAVGVLCEGCYNTWAEAYFYMTTDELLAEVKANASFRSAFERCCKLRKDRVAMSFRLAEVGREVRVGCRLRRRFACFNKTAFLQKYGVTPDSLNMKPVELADELGDVFQCFLVEQDPASSRSVDIYFDTSCAKTDFWVHPSTVLHKDQADEGFRHLSAEPKSSLHRKAGKAWTEARVRDAISQFRTAAQAAGSDESDVDGPGFAATADSDSFAMATALPAASAAGAPSTEGLAPVGVPAAEASPAKAPMQPPAAPAARSPACTRTAPSLSARSCFEGTPSLARSASGPSLGPAGKAGPARSVDEHISRLNLTSILGGAKCGSEYRWARRFFDDNMSKHPECAILGRHLSAVKAALAINERLETMSDVQLRECLEELEAHGCDWPSNLKHQFVERKVAQWVQVPDRFAQSSALLDVVVPWLDRASMDDDPDQRFRPLEPRASMCEGSVQEKCSGFRRVLLKQVLTPSIRLGEECADGVKQFCSALIQRLEAVDDVDEDFGLTIQELLRVARVLKSALDGAYCEACDDGELDAFLKAMDTKSSKNLAAVLATNMMDDAFYKGCLESLQRFAVPNLEHGDSIRHMVASLPNKDPAAKAAAVDRALSMHDAVSGKVGPALAKLLREAAETALADVALACTDAIDAGRPLPFDCGDAERIIGRAQASFGPTESRAALLDKLAKVRQQQKTEQAMEDCDRLCEQAYTEVRDFGGVSAATAAALSPLLRRHVPDKPADLGAGVRKFVQMAMDQLLGVADNTLDEREGLHDILSQVQMLHMSLTYDGDRKFDFMGVFRFCEVMLKGLRSATALRDMISAGGCYDDAVTTHLSLTASVRAQDKYLASLPAVAKDLFDQVAERMQEVAHESCAEQLGAQEFVVRGLADGPLKTTAGGGDEIHFWWNHGLAATATLVEAVRHAAHTLDKAKGSDIKKACDNLDAALKRYIDLKAMHSQPMEAADYPAWLKEAAELLRKGRATIFTACALAHMRSHHSNGVKLKGAIKPLLVDAEKDVFGGGYKELVHPTVYKAAKDAVAMRLVWVSP